MNPFWKMRIELAVVEINRVSILLEEFLKHDDLANAGHHLPAESCWFGISLGYGKLEGAGQVHGRVSQASMQRTSPEEHPAAH